jgi:serine/threonine protein kinase
MGDISIPGYEIIELIGRGGMASVWKARQVSLDRTVAVKILASSFADQPSDIQRFHEEARVAARLRHSGIVQVIDAGAHSGLYYFVMEFIDGYTVGSWLRRKGVLSEGDALAVADCVADALGYAWEQSGMVHCDIKPENILVDSDGTVKVADLGLSRTLNAMQRLDEEEEILGTPAYMSPEQARGEAGMDCRADMYSLGAMLYELVTGQRLFHGLSDDEVMVQQLQGQAPGPHEINRQLSVRMSELIELLLAKDKEQRPADWVQVRQLIKRVKRGHPLPLRLSEQAACTVRRRPAPRQNWQADMAHRNMRRWKRSDKSRHLQLLIGLVVIAFLALIIYGVRRNRLSAPIRVDPPRLKRVAPSSPMPRPAQPVSPPVSVSHKQPARPASHGEAPALAREWRAVQQWIAKQPGSPGEGAWRIKKLLPSLAGTVYEAPARAEMNRLNVLQARLEAEEARQNRALRLKREAERRQKLKNARRSQKLRKKPTPPPAAG